MRILWVKVGGLWPLNTGGRLRSFHIIADLSRRHRMIVATTHGPGDDPEGLAAALPHCEQVTSVPYTAPKRGSIRYGAVLFRSWLSSSPLDFWRWQVTALRRQVTRILMTAEVNLCVADFVYATPNIPLTSPVPVILFAHNVEHVIWQRLSQVETRAWRRAGLELESWKMRRWEAQLCAQTKLTIAVSDVDRDLLASLATGARLCTIPTGVDLSYFTPNGALEAPAHLVFSGSLDWYPNDDAIVHFIDNILPSIQRDVPETTVTVVGRNPTPRLLRAAARASVHVTGTVDDVRPYIARAAIHVVPLRIGGGTRLKILEALAMGKAVVSTGVGAEGLPLEPGVHFVRADDSTEFAHAVVSLLRDAPRRRALGMAGRRLVEERCSWAHVARDFEAWCLQAGR